MPYIGSLLFSFILYCLSPFPWWQKTVVTQSEFILLPALTGCLSIAFTSYKLLKKNSIRLSIIDISVLILFLYIVLSSFFSPVKSDVIAINTYYSPFIFYCIFRVWLPPKAVWSFVYILITAVLLQICFDMFMALPQSIGTRASFFNSGLFGGFIAIGTIASVSVLLHSPLIRGSSKIKSNIFRMIFRVILILVTCLEFYYIYKTGSRASVIAVCICLPVLFVSAIKKSSPIHLLIRKYRLPVFLAFAILILGIGCCAYIIRPASADGRLLIWSAGLEMIKDKPVLGHGTGGFRQNYMSYQAVYLERHKDSDFSLRAADSGLAFNESLKIAVEYGITGYIIALILLGLAFTAAGNKGNVYGKELHVLKIILLAIAVFGMFSYPGESFRFRLVFVICLAFISGMSSKIRVIHITSGSKLAFFVVSGFIFTACCSQAINFYKFNKACHRLDYIYRQDGVLPNQVVGLLDSLYPELKHTVQYLSYYDEILIKTGNYKQALRINKQWEACFASSSQQLGKGISCDSLGLHEIADSAYIMASRMMPVLIKPHYLLAKSYYRQKRYGEALSHARIAINKGYREYTPEIYYMRKEMQGLIRRLREESP